MTNIPEINTERREGYAALIAHNWDTVQEAFRVKIPVSLAERLEKGRIAALDAHEGQGMLFFFGGGNDFQIWSGGSQGNKWVIEDDDIQIHFRTEKESCKWPVTVRYKAAGLWEHGFQSLRDRVVHLLEQECSPIIEEGETLEDWCHISRADYCFDFYSPSFSEEMRLKMLRDNVCLTSGVKMGVIGTSTGDETITIGMNRKGLQVQIYDKGKEITEISGKTWMFKVWEREGYYPPDDLKAKNVWRVEIRFGKDFMKDRNIRTFEALSENIEELLAEGLMRRRIVEDEGDDPDHKERWRLHPLWSEVYHASGAAGSYIPVGRQTTLKRDEMIGLLEKQMTGLTRSISVLEKGHFDEHLAVAKSFQAAKAAEADPEHENKTRKCVERYRHIDEAQ